MLDGRNGKVLWQMNATFYEMTSDLVMRTTEKHRDAFVFRIEGVNGRNMNMVRESRTLLIGASDTDAQYFESSTRVSNVLNQKQKMFPPTLLILCHKHFHLIFDIYNHNSRNRAI